jgi:transketolase
VTIVACGVTVREAERAADTLKSDGISVRMIDCYSVKPIDAYTFALAARETGGIATVEEHWPEGGLGDAVLGVLAREGSRTPVIKSAVREMPGSGSPRS